MADLDAVMKSRLFDYLRNSPNILKRITVFAKSFQDTNDAIDFFLNNWGASAAGVILDWKGGLIGVYRPPAQEDPENIFTLCGDGDTDDLDGSTGFFDDTDPDVTLGGYLTGEDGLESLSDPGAQASDEYMGFLIGQKAASFRSRATHENVFLYLLAFGGRTIIDDSTQHVMVYDPVTYYDLDEWQKYYIRTRGFKPGCITISFREKMRNEDPI